MIVSLAGGSDTTVLEQVESHAYCRHKIGCYDVFALQVGDDLRFLGVTFLFATIMRSLFFWAVGYPLGAAVQLHPATRF